MGKYRTCGTVANSANRVGVKCATSATAHPKDIQSHLPQPPAAKNDGNTRGKFQGNSLNYQRRATRRSIIVTFYALVLAASYLTNFVSNYANAQPIFSTRIKSLGETTPPSTGSLQDDLVTEGADNQGGVDDGGGGVATIRRNCTTPSADDFPADLFSMEQRRHGALVFHFVVSVYLFYAVLLVCDEYFIPAVECICSEKKIPSDLAGATFMAVSTSSPELFTNVIGTFLTSGDLGVGTIVGSAVFNILAVGALCGIGAGYSIKTLTTPKDKIGLRLDWWPLTRDSFFYLLSVGALILILYNRRVYWYEALLMILLYLVYILVLCYDSKIKGCVQQLLATFYTFFSIRWGEEPRRIGIIIVSATSPNERTPLLLKVTEKNDTLSVPLNKTNGFLNGEIKPMYKSSASAHDLLLSKEYDIPASSLDELLVQNALSRSNSFCAPVGDGEDEKASWCKWPTLPEEEIRSWSAFLGFVVSYPIRFALWVTVPDCKVQVWRKWYWVTLAMCVLWIAGLTYLISWMVTIIGETLAIPDSVTGLTFLAAGTSIPEVISSLIVARQGLGAMAFSNTIGSNTFDVLVCLGLPWLLKAVLLSSSEVNYVEIHSAGMEFSAIILISALVLLYLCVAFNGFILDRNIGIGCFLMYIVFITFACMMEMNVFFPVNLPPC